MEMLTEDDTMLVLSFDINKDISLRAFIGESQFRALVNAMVRVLGS